MTSVTLKGSPCTLAGSLPEVGAAAPDFQLVTSDLSAVSLDDCRGGTTILLTVPSIDTPVCALSTKKFNDHAREHDDTVMLMVSADLPFAHSRFCGNENLENVHSLSTMRSPEFATNYGVHIADGPMASLTARAVVVLDENDTVVYAELVPEIADEPDYESALKALG